MNRYTAAELAFVKRRCKLPRRELLLAFKRKFPRREVTLGRLKDLCDRNHWGVGSPKGRRKGQSSLYSKAELAFIKRRRKMPRRELHAAFVERFRRGDISCDKIKQLCKRNGWSNGHAGSRAKKGQTKFSKAEIAFIRRRSETPRRQLHAEFVGKFQREMALTAFKSFCKRFGAFTGRTGGFEKGHVPWSKGKKLPFNLNVARTQFKKGQLPGNTKHDGHERIDAQTGFVLVRVSERNPWTGAATRYVPKQHVLWRAKRGPIPKGMALKCKDDPANPDPSNWELVPRGVLPRLNGKSGRGYETAPAEVKPTIMAIAKLEHRLAEKGKSR